MNYNTKRTTGLVLGKFMPLHKGHQYLIDFALNYCDNLTIVMDSIPGQPIDGKLRHKWLQEMYGHKAEIIWLNQDMPQEPKDENDDKFWKTWRMALAQKLGYGDLATGKVVDYVFASEQYGVRLAYELRAEFIPVDIGREIRSTSGTSIRASIYDNWEHLTQPVRNHYVKTVTMFGPESTGKTTIARILAKAYNTIYVPEYGRIYTEQFGTDLVPEDLHKIVKGHEASVKAAKLQANRLIIEDTDPIMTAVWSDMLFGRQTDMLYDYKSDTDLYILCDITGVEWEDDGTRYFPTDSTRELFMVRCITELERRKLPYITVQGSIEQRYCQAVDAIHELGIS